MAPYCMKEESNNNAALWTVRQAAANLATTPRAIYRMVGRREIPFVRFGRNIRIDPAALGRWLEENSIPLDRRGR